MTSNNQRLKKAQFLVLAGDKALINEINIDWCSKTTMEESF
jgi:hypothetical protein